MNAELRHAEELLRRDPRFDLCALFGPEHGFAGDAQDMIAVTEGGSTPSGMKIYSLYGDSEESLRPKAEMLEDLDLLIIDLQDIGSRYYTYAATMSYCLEAAAAAGLKVLVCDRPNPIDGKSMEGNLVDPAYRSFVGHHPLPNRHGMTMGELARLFNEAYGLSCELEVIPMEGWDRAQLFSETGLPWVLPSPNMPTLETALVYPGMCLVEGTNLSEGRGTTRPFELVGAPFLDGRKLAGSLEKEELPGILFRPCRFTPTFQKWAGQLCEGLQLHISDPRTFQPLKTGVALLKAVLAQNPVDFAWRTEPYEFVSDRLAIDLLAGNDRLRHQLEGGAPLGEITGSWQDELEAFLPLREKYLLY